MFTRIGRSTLIGFMALLAALTMPAQGMAASPAAQQVSEARDVLRGAQSQVGRLEERAKKKLQADAEWVRLQSAVNEAARERDVTREHALAEVRAGAEHVAARKQLADAQGDLDREQALREPSPRIVDDAHGRMLDARFKIKALERDGVEKAPAVLAADARLADARAYLDRKWNDYVNTVLSTSPAWMTANRTLLRAQADLEKAEQAMLRERAGR